MDPLEAVFVFCFVFGVATMLLSFLLGSFSGFHGALGGHGAFGGHDLPGGHHPGLQGGHGPAAGAHGAGAAHADAAHGLDAESDGRGLGVSPFNLQSITAFLAFFGGVGWVMYESLGVAPAIALLVGAVAGLAGGATVFWFLAKVLLAGQTFLDPAGSRMEGMVGRVSQPIGPTTIGEIVYSRDGGRHSEGARSATGLPIPVGTEVVIVRYEQGIAHVEPWASFSQES